MKQLFKSIMLLAGLGLALASCDTLASDEGTDKTDTLFGSWQLDKLTIEASTSVGGNGGQNTSVVDFTSTPCYLDLDDDMVATAQMGFDIEMSGYSYDQKAKTLKFNRSLSVSNDGKAMVLVGTYEITELTDSKLTLRQPDTSIDIPGIFTANQTAIYAFHRTKD